MENRENQSPIDTVERLIEVLARKCRTSHRTGGGIVLSGDDARDIHYLLELNYPEAATKIYEKLTSGKEDKCLKKKD